MSTVVCLVMIVKNESTLIAETLTELRPFIDVAVICDTGSSDATPQIVQRVCKSLELPLQFFEHEWKDFGYNRTLAFASARATVPGVDWYMVFDADDRIVGDFPEDALAQVPKEVDALYCTYGSMHMQFQRLTFFRATLEWGYRGVLHEYACCLSKPEVEVTKQKLEGNYFIHINSRGTSDRSRDPQKFIQDAEILVCAINDPTTESDLLSRYLFYAARSFMDAKQYPRAIEYFDRYLENRHHWAEERYESRMGKARCMLATWPIYCDSELRDAFLMASVEDPERAEPWYELARWYRIHRKDYFLAYAFAKIGSAHLIPPKRLLFVDLTVYTYRLLDELAISAYWTGRVKECRELCLTLLARTDLPTEDRERIRKNLTHCHR